MIISQLWKYMDKEACMTIHYCIETKKTVTLNTNFNFLVTCYNFLKIE